MWDLAVRLHSPMVTGQVWCWAFALPGSSCWQRTRGHTDINVEDETSLQEACVHGTQQIGTILSAPASAIKEGKGWDSMVQARRLLSTFGKIINIFTWRNKGVTFLSGNMVNTSISARWWISVSLWNWWLTIYYWKRGTKGKSKLDLN